MPRVGPPLPELALPGGVGGGGLHGGLSEGGGEGDDNLLRPFFLIFLISDYFSQLFCRHASWSSPSAGSGPGGDEEGGTSGRRGARGAGSGLFLYISRAVFLFFYSSDFSDHSWLLISDGGLFGDLLGGGHGLLGLVGGAGGPGGLGELWAGGSLLSLVASDRESYSSVSLSISNISSCFCDETPRYPCNRDW